MHRHFGRRPHKPTVVARLPHFAKYITATAAPLATADWTRNVQPGGWKMYLNDTLGDCTAAGIAHAGMTFGSYNPPYQAMTDADVLHLYEQTGGYIPGDASTDQGALCTDVINYWLQQPIAGQKLLGVMTVNPHDLREVRLAIDTFGGLYTGVVLRVAQETQQVWSTENGDQSIAGGHCVWAPACDDSGFGLISWGERLRGEWKFWTRAVDECYALLTDKWVQSGRTPAGFPLDQVIAETQAAQLS